MRNEKDSLRSKFINMFRGCDHIKYLSQFSLDWIQEFEDEFPINVEDRAIAYEVDTIYEVLAFGNDREFFGMLATYARFWVKGELT